MLDARTFHEAVAALTEVRFSNENNTYEGLVWKSPPEGFVPPTKQEVEAELAKFDAAIARITVSRLRFKLELAERDLLPGVDGTIATLPGAQGDTARLYWAEATEFESDHALVLSIGALLDPPLSPTEIREMFEAARDRVA